MTDQDDRIKDFFRRDWPYLLARSTNRDKIIHTLIDEIPDTLDLTFFIELMNEQGINDLKTQLIEIGSALLYACSFFGYLYRTAERAVEAFQALLRLDTEDAKAYRWLALAQVEQAYTVRALPARSSFRGDPLEFDVDDELLQEAFGNLMEAVRLAPNDSDSQQLIVQLYAGLHKEGISLPPDSDLPRGFPWGLRPSTKYGFFPTFELSNLNRRSKYPFMWAFFFQSWLQLFTPPERERRLQELKTAQENQWGPKLWVFKNIHRLLHEDEEEKE